MMGVKDVIVVICPVFLEPVQVILVCLVRWGGLERLQRMVIARDVARMDMAKREKRVASQWNALV